MHRSVSYLQGLAGKIEEPGGLGSIHPIHRGYWLLSARPGVAQSSDFSREVESGFLKGSSCFLNSADKFELCKNSNFWTGITYMVMERELILGGEHAV